MTWDQIITWLVVPVLVALVLGGGSILLARRERADHHPGKPAE
jgi:hypothetical protein